MRQPLFRRIRSPPGRGNRSWKCVVTTYDQNTGGSICTSLMTAFAVSPMTALRKKQFVICHHLNYFVAEAELKAMADVQW